jgi:hypothetical protein
MGKEQRRREREREREEEQNKLTTVTKSLTSQK